MKRIVLMVVAATAIMLGGIGAAYAASADKPGDPPGQGPCEHGNSGKPCREDPNDHGKDCEEHGPKEGGVNEDHCLGDETTTTDTTTTTETTTTVETTTTQETTTSDQPTTPGETTPTPSDPAPVVPADPPANEPGVTVTKEQDSEGNVVIVKKNKKTGAVAVKRPGGKFVPAIQGQG